MKRPTIDDQVDAALAARGSEPAFVPAAAPAWLAAFEQNLPLRLPPAYRSLLLRYRFPAFEVGSVTLFGNLDGRSEDDLVVASLRDSIISSVTLRNGFVQIGRSGHYDPVCFDLRRRPKSGEAKVVLSRHEEILVKNSVCITEPVAASFLELLARAPRTSGPRAGR